jgi:hypothetical protein
MEKFKMKLIHKVGSFLCLITIYLLVISHVINAPGKMNIFIGILAVLSMIYGIYFEITEMFLWRANENK